MAGISDRVQAFLDSWPLIKEKIEKEEDEGLFHSDRACGSFRGEPKDDLQAPMG